MADRSDEETARRRDEALRRALNTPPKPKGGKKPAPKDVPRTRGGPARKGRGPDA